MKPFTKQAACAAGKSAAQTAMKQSKYMRKTAEDSATFNETVPQIAPNQNPNDFYGTQGEKQPRKNTGVQQAGQEDQFAAVPAGYEDQQAPMDFPQAPAEMIGAAQSFLGPEVMQAASQGDANAMDLVARTAAHVGMNFSNMASAAQPVAGMDQEGAQDQMGGMQPGQGQMGVSSPEDDLINELVPNMQTQMSPMQQTGEAPVPGQQIPQGTGADNATQDAFVGQNEPQSPDGAPAGSPDHIDVHTVAKLINLAKAGKI
jgi:hypothetical protein